MKKWNNKFTVTALIAVFAIGIFSVNLYQKNNSPYDSEYGILTPESEEIDGMVINDPMVPLDPTPSDQTAENPYLQQVVDLCNAEREKAGLSPLTMDSELNAAAQIRAEEIYTLFSHDRPNGSRYRTVIDEQGISYMGCGENVAYGFRTPEAVVEAWMNSEGHKANILNEKYTSIGIGYNKGSNEYHYWAQLFTY